MDSDSTLLAAYNDHNCHSLSDYIRIIADCFNIPSILTCIHWTLTGTSPLWKSLDFMWLIFKGQKATNVKHCILAQLL